MGNSMSCQCCCRKPRPSKIYNVLLLGLTGAGKTEIGMKLTGNVREDFSSTNGVRRFKKFYGNDLINIIEIGGNVEMRKIWHHYYVNAMGVIFVIDIADLTNLSYSQSLLLEVMKNEYISGKPVAVVATKADLSDEIDIIELNNSFGIERMANHFRSYMLLKRIGLFDVFELLETVRWMQIHIDMDYQSMLNRIEFDKKDATEKKIPVLHYSDRRLIQSARTTINRMSSMLISRPHSAPSATLQPPVNEDVFIAGTSSFRYDVPEVYSYNADRIAKTRTGMINNKNPLHSVNL